MITKDYAHLLNRAEHTFDNAHLNEELRGKRILVTGAGGSIGSALTRRILAASPDKVYALGHGEDSIFQLLQSLPPEHRERVHPMIQDAYSPEVNTLLNSAGLHYVFHTAAHKHVGLMETNPRAAVANNTQATLWLARLCKQHGVRLVYLSTDKAVKPKTVMGASKKLAEAWIDANCMAGTGYCNAVTIRLGNVLGSAGSLVEILERYAVGKSSSTFCLNHPGMARYFITVNEAVGTILTGGMDFPGKYSLDMGSPITVDEIFGKMCPGQMISSKTCVDEKFLDEKIVEDLLEDDETYETHSVFASERLLSIKRTVNKKLVSAVLEIVEDNANANTGAAEFGKLLVNMANRL